MRAERFLAILTVTMACTERNTSSSSDVAAEIEQDTAVIESAAGSPDEGGSQNLGAEIYMDLLTRTVSASTTTESLFSFRPGKGASSKGPLAARLYQQKAQATVAIRLPNGHGTGFLLEPASDGWVLTNHHVASEGARDENGRVVVTVEFGRLRDGVMQRHPRVGRAFVYDWDPDQDLALLKLAEPPPTDVGLEVADAVPTPGSSVVLFGQGGVGLMWQVRECEISAIGTIGDDFSLLPTDCQQFAKVEPDAASRCRELVSQTRSMRLADVRYVQSTCKFAGGDSGGPLLDQDGALVGVSSFYKTSNDPQRPSEAGYFHIHRDEVEAFLNRANRSEPHTDDGSADGGLRFGRLPADSMLRGQSQGTNGGRVALVQNDQIKGILVNFDSKGLPADGPFTTARSALSADFALSVTADGLSAEYDENGDGTFELTLIAGQAPLPVAVGGSGGSSDAFTQYLGQKIVRGDIFGPKRSETLMAILSELVPPTLLGSTASSPLAQFPDSYRDTGSRLAVDSVSGALVFYSVGQPAEAWLIDLDGDSLGARATMGAARTAYAQQMVDWEFAIIHSGPYIWSFYNFDATPGPEDILFTTQKMQVLFASKGSSLQATRASGQQPPCRLSLIPKELRPRVREVAGSLFRMELCQ